MGGSASLAAIPTARVHRCIAAALMAAAPAVAQEGSPSRTIDLVVPGNPLIADGSVFSADPAPFVAEGKLYILSGRDEAEPDVNDFIMKEWQLFSTGDPASGRWTDRIGSLRPHEIFKWAEPGGAFAGQIVKGIDGRYYLYGPVREAAAEGDRFGIGVAVAARPEGPYVDAHPSGPIASQKTPNAKLQNIDPTVLVDDDGRVYMYWGTFGELRAVELARDMVTLKGIPKTIAMRGFFEAPWLMKRKGTYYLLYADNEWTAGQTPPECTPAYYHACQAYATAPGPMGPWTYRGVYLRPVSSTTSHAGAVEFGGQWWLAYHTADATGGGHFRRSVAVDRLEWDDTQSPPAIKLLTPTRRPGAAPVPQRNVAPAAVVTASNTPVPGQYWVEAVHDGKTREAILPPEMWGNWTDRNDRPGDHLQYSWQTPQKLSGTRAWFWTDSPPGSDAGTAPPASWRIDYWANGRWRPVKASGAYPVDATNRFVEVGFAPVTTTCLRLVMQASGKGGRSAALGVQEWEALAVAPRIVERVAPGTAAPACR